MTNNMQPKKRVLLIAPVLPFRGGISQHTTMLARALSNCADSLTISFSRQYPAFIFPGDSDKDPAYDGHQEKNTAYIIDSINPLSWFSAFKAIMKFGPDAVVIPWWTFFLAPCFWFFGYFLRMKKLKVILFCHNVEEHEEAWWKNQLTRLVLKTSSHYVVHTQADRNNLLKLFPDAKIVVHPHPIYDHFPHAQRALPRRKSLELLFFGFVRPYKGLNNLIDTMILLKGEDIQLTIAGEFWGKETETETAKKIRESGLEDQIELSPRYHSDEETAELFSRADAVVLPYRSATGSGVIPIAYHYNKPVIVTKVGGLPDVVKEGKTGLIVEPENIAELAKAIKHMQTNGLINAAEEISAFKKSLSWESLAKSIMEI